MTLRIRPKSDYLQQASWDSLYALTEHWKSDLAFYVDEMKFLKNLTGKYYIWLIKDDNLQKIELVVNKLNATEKNLNKISIATDEHMHHIESIIDNSFTYDEVLFRNDHEKLEDNIAGFVNDFRNLKRELFNATKLLLKEEKMKKLSI